MLPLTERRTREQRQREVGWRGQRWGLTEEWREGLAGLPKQRTGRKSAAPELNGEGQTLFTFCRRCHHRCHLGSHLQPSGSELELCSFHPKGLFTLCGPALAGQT